MIPEALLSQEFSHLHFSSWKLQSPNSPKEGCGPKALNNRDFDHLLLNLVLINPILGFGSSGRWKMNGICVRREQDGDFD